MEYRGSDRAHQAGGAPLALSVYMHIIPGDIIPDEGGPRCLDSMEQDRKERGR